MDPLLSINFVPTRIEFDEKKKHYFFSPYSASPTPISLVKHQTIDAIHPLNYDPIHDTSIDSNWLLGTDSANSLTLGDAYSFHSKDSQKSVKWCSGKLHRANFAAELKILNAEFKNSSGTAITEKKKTPIANVVTLNLKNIPKRKDASKSMPFRDQGLFSDTWGGRKVAAKTKSPPQRRINKTEHPSLPELNCLQIAPPDPFMLM